MTNLEISLVLKEISELMELKGENYYKFRAYRQGARQIEKLSEEITRLVQENRMRQVPRIGEGIAKTVEEVVRTGRSTLLEELRSEVPTGLRRILGIPGIGVKSSHKLFEELKISTVKELKKACEEGKIKDHPGFGEKFQQKVLEGISKLENAEKTTLLGIALPMSESIVKKILSFSEVTNAEITGSVRRRMEVVEDIDILVETTEPEKVKEHITELPAVYQVLDEKDHVLSVLNTVGIKVEFYFTTPKIFHYNLLISTGNEQHINRLMSVASKQGVKLERDGLYKNNKLIDIYSEQEVYDKINLPYIAPELREGRGEIEGAMEKNLPNVVKKSEIKGDLHIHTNWSDGASSLEDMIDIAKQYEYQYIAITDHSQSLKIASGLSKEQLEKQIEKINVLNEKNSGIRILSGVEVDILRDGTLDFHNHILEQLDFVIASIHQGFQDSGVIITKRICQAMENPYVKAIAHPTGRIIGKRKEFNLDFKKIFQKANETNTAIEINSSIDRLDLSERYLSSAKEYDVKFLINTDAHSVVALRDINYGLYVARRAWLTPEQIINTYDLNDFMTWLSD
ncbi:DNA polymerase/3'-5' exonuclease PolX [Natranaerobius trueperi]|uniref:DNA polymerase/3'-5' exonuclease PolX n=1 Tax=Natranaerobius trueperi TaxID=759412 RepID=A0A226BVG1_9FIRM|nr:DNA polymerase/3'-5' exonuclease PolX [Natranaerobius trueperi]OWZ82871.1 DNA polymerase/3'-5' exonuclease PolX [Natranaerobius trueperi]